MTKINGEDRIVGLIPAAGKGTRLAPLPFSKELFPLGYQQLNINGEMQWRPKVVSHYLIENMMLAGITKIFIVLGNNKETIMEYYGNGSRWGIKIAYLFQEELHGMPYALDLIRPWITDETIVFGMPDTVMRPESVFKRLLDSHFSLQADLTIAAFKTLTPQKFGMIELDEQERVINNIDKPQKTNLEYMWGAACWSPVFTELLGNFLCNCSESHQSKEVVLSEVFQYAIKCNLKVRAVKFLDGEYLDMGTVEELQQAIIKYSELPSRENLDGR